MRAARRARDRGRAGTLRLRSDDVNRDYLALQTVVVRNRLGYCLRHSRAVTATPTSLLHDARLTSFARSGSSQSPDTGTLLKAPLLRWSSRCRTNERKRSYRITYHARGAA